MKRFYGLVVAICMSLVCIFSATSVSAASSQIFGNCRQLQKKYQWGVALNRVSAANSKKAIVVLPKVYKANIKLDFDNDGVVCEIESLQNRTPSVTTSTTIPSKIVTVPQPFGDGVFKVGIDIAPGRYISGGKNCGYEVATSKPSELQPKWGGSTRLILDVLSTDFSVTSKGCNVWTPMVGYTLAKAPGDGDWVVGLEFPAGVWQSAEPKCIWTRMSGFRGPYGPTQLNTSLFDLRSSYTYVRVLPTDVGLSSINCGVWTRYNE